MVSDFIASDDSSEADMSDLASAGRKRLRLFRLFSSTSLILQSSRQTRRIPIVHMHRVLVHGCLNGDPLESRRLELARGCLNDGPRESRRLVLAPGCLNDDHLESGHTWLSSKSPVVKTKYPVLVPVPNRTPSRSMKYAGCLAGGLHARRYARPSSIPIAKTKCPVLAPIPSRRFCHVIASASTNSDDPSHGQPAIGCQDRMRSSSMKVKPSSLIMTRRPRHLLLPFPKMNRPALALITSRSPCGGADSVCISPQRPPDVQLRRSSHSATGRQEPTGALTMTATKSKSLTLVRRLCHPLPLSSICGTSTGRWTVPAQAGVHARKALRTPTPRSLTSHRQHSKISNATYPCPPNASCLRPAAQGLSMTRNVRGVART